MPGTSRLPANRPNQPELTSSLSALNTVQHASDYEDEDDSGIIKTQDGEQLSLPVRFRRGWMLGDGTGAGKGRQVAAVILDNWLQGRRRALWLSKSNKLVEDAQRDWTATGDEAWDAVLKRGSSLPLANGWRLARRLVAGLDHVELEGPDDTDTDTLRKLGFTIEIVNWRARVFAPAPHVLDRLFARWPLQG